MMHSMSLNFFVYFLFEIVNNLKAGTNIGMKNYNQQISLITHILNIDQGI